MLYYERYLKSSFSCFGLSICLFNSLFSSLQCTLMHFVGGNEDLASSSKLVTVRVGIVVAAMTVGCRLLGSCVLLTPAIECRSILAINTSIDPRSTLDRHLGRPSVDPRWHTVDISVDRLSIFVDTLSSGDRY